MKVNKLIGTSVLMALVFSASASAFAQRGDEKQKQKAPPQQQQRQQAPPAKAPPQQQQQKQQAPPERQQQQAQRSQPPQRQQQQAQRSQQTQPTRQPQQAQRSQPVQQQQQAQRSQPHQRDQRSSEQLQAAQQSRSDYRGSYAASTSRSARYENAGRRIPDDRFRASFGSNHYFRFHTQFVGGGYSRFQYGGFWFGMYDPWPYDWYDTDDVYVDYDSYSGNYYLYNRFHPGARLQINVVL